MRDTKRKYDAINMINYCNTQITNSTDYAIARTILGAVEDPDHLSLEMLSERAAVSQTSVSRFVKKAGFPSFQAFKYAFASSLREMHSGRQMHHMRHYGQLDTEGLMDKTYRIGLDNLKSTMEKVKPEELEEIVEIMRNAKSVSFFGDDHALSDIYLLQLDLAAAGVPAYIYKLQDIQQMHAQSLGEGDVAIYLSAFSEWMTKPERTFFRHLHKEKKATLIGFFQDTDEEIEEYFDRKILYGIPKSKNRGFFSLLLIQRTLSELIYNSSDMEE